ARLAFVLADEEWPPGLAILLARQRQYADGGHAVDDGAHDLPRLVVGGCRHQAAEMIARQVPVAAARFRREHGDRERTLLAQRRQERPPPHAHDRGPRQCAAMALDEATYDERFAAGPEETSAAASAIALQRSDLSDQGGAPDQQVMQLGVDLVDLPAEIVNR